MGYLNDQNIAKAFTKHIHVNVWFYRVPDIKPTFRLPLGHESSRRDNTPQRLG